MLRSARDTVHSNCILLCVIGYYFSMPSIRSSAISHVEYNDRLQTLAITFTSGREYTYFDVPRHIYDAFLASSSKGTFFNTHIRDQYSEG
jgi:hypothetical protein